MARGEEPPFDLEDLLRRYGSSPPNPEVPLRHFLLGQLKIHQIILRSHARTVENLCVVVRIFKLHVGCWDVCVGFQMQSIYVVLTKSC